MSHPSALNTHRVLESPSLEDRSDPLDTECEKLEGMKGEKCALPSL